jgi:predicted ester cyclase
VALWAPDVAWEVPGASLRGRAEVLAHFSAYWEALPDMYQTIDREVEAGPFAATGARCTGTHQGTLRTPGGDIPPTGRRVDFTLGEIYEV